MNDLFSEKLKIIEKCNNELNNLTDSYKKLWKILCELFVYICNEKKEDFNVCVHFRKFPYLANNEDFLSSMKYTFYLMITNLKEKTDIEMIFNTFIIKSKVERKELDNPHAAVIFSRMLYDRHTKHNMSKNEQMNATKYFSEQLTWADHYTSSSK
jgi:hypothetical protein